MSDMFDMEDIGYFSIFESGDILGKYYSLKAQASKTTSEIYRLEEKINRELQKYYRKILGELNLAFDTIKIISHMIIRYLLLIICSKDLIQLI